MATKKIWGPPPTLSTGKLLQAYIVKHRICKAALARVTDLNISSLVKILQNDNIKSGILWNICFALQHNFFADIADQLPKEFGSDVVVDDTAEKRVVELERENEILRDKVGMLEGILRGR